MNEEKKPSRLDFLLDRIISRKFFALVISTIVFALKLITPDMWMGIVMTYMGVQGLSDVLEIRTKQKNAIRSLENVEKVVADSTDSSAENKDKNAE